MIGRPGAGNVFAHQQRRRPKTRGVGLGRQQELPPRGGGEGQGPTPLARPHDRGQAGLPRPRSGPLNPRRNTIMKNLLAVLALSALVAAPTYAQPKNEKQK